MVLDYLYPPNLTNKEAPRGKDQSHPNFFKKKAALVISILLATTGHYTAHKNKDDNIYKSEALRQ